jgi:hypothetical protein
MVMHGVMVVWGEAYTSRFLEVFLPSLLSEGNLPALLEQFPCRFTVYTTPEDAGRMAASLAWSTLRSLVPVTFEALDAVPRDPLLDPVTLPGKFRTLAACHHHAMRGAAVDDAAMLLLGPDTLVSDGALHRVARLAGEGRRGLLLNHLSVTEDTFVPALERAFPADARGARRVPPRDLTRTALEHPHPWQETLFLGDGPFQVCSQMCWRVPGGGQVTHAWHLSPFFLHPQRLPARPFLTVDNDYTCQVIDDPATLQVPDDSDQVSFVELLPRRADRVTRPQPYPFSPLRFALGAEGLFPSPHGAHLVRQGIRWHGGEPGPRFAAVELRAQAVVAEVLAWMHRLEWPAGPGALEPERRPEAMAMAETLRQDLRALDRPGARERHPGQRCHLWANLGKLEGLLGRVLAAREALERQLALGAGNPATAARVARRARDLGLGALAERAAGTVQPFPG